MKGADQCPKCASRKWADFDFPLEATNGLYASSLRCCANCKTVWEPFDTKDLLDEDLRYSSFKTPCENCAFRKGSHEQQDKAAWQNTLDKLGWFGGRFYCHKGVPISPQSEHGFDYPTKPDGAHDERKLRLCRGYLNALPELPEDQTKWDEATIGARIRSRDERPY